MILPSTYRLYRCEMYTGDVTMKESTTHAKLAADSPPTRRESSRIFNSGFHMKSSKAFTDAIEGDIDRIAKWVIASKRLVLSVKLMGLGNRPARNPNQRKSAYVEPQGRQR